MIRAEALQWKRLAAHRGKLWEQVALAKAYTNSRDAC